MGTDLKDIDQLLERLRNGDQQALGELFSRYREPLRRMVEFRLDRRLQGRVAPSDVLQEAYIAALQRFEHFFEKPGASFYVWLRLIANQSLIDLHRRHLAAKMRAAGQEIPVDGAWTHATSMSIAMQLVAALETPSQAAGRAELLARVEAALEEMDPIDREVLTMRHFEELGNSEVAEILGIAKSAASNRYVRALERLRGALRAAGVIEEE